MRIPEKAKNALILAAILLVAFGLRWVNIGGEPYWGDEVLSLDIATSIDPVQEMVRYVAEVEVHPPLYYLALRGWVAMFGATEAATRSLSVLFSLGIVVVGYLLGTRLFSARTGHWAALILAVLPLQVEYGQEARPYAMFCFFASVAIWAYVERARGGKHAWLAVYVLASVTAFYLHYSALFSMVALAIWWLGKAARTTKEHRSRAVLEWLVVHAAVFLLAYPWFVPLLYKVLLGGFLLLDHPRNAAPLRAPDVVVASFDALIWTTKQKHIGLLEVGGKVVAMGVLVFAGMHSASKRAFEDHACIRFLLWMLGATTLLFVFSPQSLLYTAIVVRHAIVATIPFALLCGAMLAGLGTRVAVAVFAIFFAAQIPFLAGVLANDAEWDVDYSLQEVGEYLTEHGRKGDMVLVPTGFSRSNLNHYLPDDLEAIGLRSIPYYGNDIWRSRTTLGFLENEMQARIDTPSDAEIVAKMDRVIGDSTVPRVWLFAFGPKDRATHRWFIERGWRHAFKSVGDTFPLDLYVAPASDAPTTR